MITGNLFYVSCLKLVLLTENVTGENDEVILYIEAKSTEMIIFGNNRRFLSLFVVLNFNSQFLLAS